MALRLAFLAAALALTAATNVQDCGSTATIRNLIITDCAVPPCHFERGTNITVDIDFKNNEASSKLTTKVTATLAGIEFPWTGADPNGCDNLTKGSCPLEVGEESHYKASAPVLQSYPSVSVIVTWKLVADSGKTTICFTVPVTVV
ncbi:NPC intracellular cholesterol transporter 2 homolog a-like [Portunus trituberculatus]|uniref:NPC intracellular cholesterol transporter 2 homolog a-like n=1 Tax=Portunus trituberculatus TaxID=210409 RepID=UPI001E1CC8D5|nr:NPC intracellular cholesterol transporter 2 homolog a-like [Portunus trituberculatus]